MKGRLTELRVLLAHEATRKTTMLSILKTGRQCGSIPKTAAALGVSARTLASILAGDDELRTRWDSLQRPVKTKGWRR